MKRDVDLSRAILRFVEEHAPPQGGVQKPLEIEGYDRPTIFAHAELLIEDGLLDGRVSKGLGGPVNVVIIKLTSRGHDSLQAIDNDTLWSKVKKTATQKGVSLTLDLAVDVGPAMTERHMTKREVQDRAKELHFCYTGDYCAISAAAVYHSAGSSSDNFSIDLLPKGFSRSVFSPICLSDENQSCQGNSGCCHVTGYSKRPHGI